MLNDLSFNQGDKLIADPNIRRQNTAMSDSSAINKKSSQSAAL